MATRDLHNNITARKALTITAIGSNTNTDGDLIDTQGFDSVEFVIQSGTVTDGTYTPVILEGDNADGSDLAASTQLLGTAAAATFVAADDNAVKRIGYKGHKRYVKLRLTSTGVATGGSLGATAVLGNPKLAPTT